MGEGGGGRGRAGERTKPCCLCTSVGSLPGFEPSADSHSVLVTLISFSDASQTGALTHYIPWGNYCPELGENREADGIRTCCNPDPLSNLMDNNDQCLCESESTVRYGTVHDQEEERFEYSRWRWSRTFYQLNRID